MPFDVTGLTLGLAGRTVLRDLSFSIRPGERVVLLGVNGCGKTTLLKALDGLIAPLAGEIRYRAGALDARALGDPVFHRRFRSEVALLFQNVDAMLFNPSASDEIAFGPRQLGAADVDARVARWARALQVEGILERPPFELSGGEKKRVALAAILALEPKVLLLDEPTAGLDPPAAEDFIDLLSSLEGTTVIASTHDLSAAQELGSRAILLVPGRAGPRFDGPTVELMGDQRLLAESGLARRRGPTRSAARE